MELRDDLRRASSPDPTLPSPRRWELTDAYQRGGAAIKRRCWIIVGAVAIVLAGAIVFSLGVRAVHPRDEADFLLAIDPVGSVGVAAPREDEELIREGDFACRWLDLQDRAFWNHGGWYSRDGLLARYVRETRPVTAGEWGSPSTWPATRGAVADAAWSQLCGGTWYWHRPHGPSLGSRGGGGDSD